MKDGGPQPKLTGHICKSPENIRREERQVGADNRTNKLNSHMMPRSGYETGHVSERQEL